MELSQQTQLDMYYYIYSGKKSFLKITEGNIQNFILNEIKIFASRLHSQAELFDMKILNRLVDGDYVKEIQYNTASNEFIYSILLQTNCCRNILAEYKDVLTYNQYLLDNPHLVEESGTLARIHLIQLCKMYLLHQQLERTSKKKEADTTGEIDIESKLAELALHKYSKYLKPFRVAPKTVKGAEGFAQSLVTDIILELPTANKALIVDVKVYKDFIVKHHDKPRYNSNENRFQMNSYIGAYLEKSAKKELNAEKELMVDGILLHIVSPEHWERLKQHNGLNGAVLTIESKRPIHLYIIPDYGLDYIFASYTKIIERYLY